MKLTESMEQYVIDTKEEVLQLLRDLAVIPAPSGREEKRAEYILQWLKSHGIESAWIDDAKNVRCPINLTDINDIYVFMAHTDVVFPDETELPLWEDDNKMYAPGIGDDTCRLVILLYAVKYFLENNISPKTGILVVADSGEEGLGNLRGCRKIVDEYGDRIKGLFTIDGGMDSIVTRAVGSHRYKVTVSTKGGHSYSNFGETNAIAVISSIVTELYKIEVPTKEGTKTTYNVGTITGGTSVNTIAQEASMLFEYRSDDMECLEMMKNSFERIMDDHSEKDARVSYELIGERPCGVTFNEDEYEEFLKPVMEASRDILGILPKREAASTDANYPLSKGVPAVCIGAGVSEGAHTRDEYVVKESLMDGLRFIIGVMSSFFVI